MRSVSPSVCVNVCLVVLLFGCHTLLAKLPQTTYVFLEQSSILMNDMCILLFVYCIMYGGNITVKEMQHSVRHLFDTLNFRIFKKKFNILYQMQKCNKWKLKL